jgi:hypothetical protein
MEIAMPVSAKVPSLPPSPSLPREPQLFRFGLRRLFLLVTLLAILLTLLVSTSGPWPLVICMVTLLVAAHVLGALLGARLRDTSPEIRHWRAMQPNVDSDQPVTADQPVRLADLELPQSTPLADSGQVMHRRRWVVGLGACVGGVCGAMAILHRGDPAPGLAALAVGTLSFYVLGGWAAFLVSSFVAIVHHAWRQAHERL